MNSHLFLGVDGGQSSTKALIGDASGRLLGRGVAGPCNHVSAAEAKAKFLRTIRECVGAAIADAGLSPDVVFEAACFGMSGGPEDKEALLREAVAAERWLVTHDALIALSGALGGEDGIVAIAGTGSIAFGRRGSQTMRTGGWGYIFGDEGGAFWIAREALREALREEEGSRPTPGMLRERLLQATGMKSAYEVLHAFYTPEWPRSRVARLAVEVSAAAAAGDDYANTILKCAGGNLAALVVSITGKLWPRERAETSYIGGVFQDRIVLDAFTRHVTPNIPHPPVWDAAGGALIEALRLVGISVPLRQV